MCQSALLHLALALVPCMARCKRAHRLRVFRRIDSFLWLFPGCPGSRAFRARGWRTGPGADQQVHSCTTQDPSPGRAHKRWLYHRALPQITTERGSSQRAPSCYIHSVLLNGHVLVERLGKYETALPCIFEVDGVEQDLLSCHSALGDTMHGEKSRL